MMIFSAEEIRQSLQDTELLSCIEDGFIAYSQGRAVIPPVGEILFPQHLGEVHIKYGYLKDDPFFVVKIASGYYDNPALGLPSSGGLVLLFDQKTGLPLALLNDGGFLTDLRTGIAGAIAAKTLAPRPISRIGVLGCGTQARVQLQLLRTVSTCRQVVAWGRHPKRVQAFAEEMGAEGFEVHVVDSPARVARHCNLIITVTPSKQPLLFWDQLQPGTHITAIGSDTPDKQELDSTILNKADVIVTDSLEQCQTRGEISKALAKELIDLERVRELGTVLRNDQPDPPQPNIISVADLTGIAIQDLQIAKLAFSRLTRRVPS